MSDLFDDLNKILKKDIVPILAKYFKDSDNKITDNLNEFLNDPKTLLADILEKFSNNKDIDNNQANFTDIENATDINPTYDSKYDELLKRLILIEENMMQIEKTLKDKN